MRILALAAFAVIGIAAAGQAWATTLAPAAVADGDETSLVVHSLTVVKGDTLSKLLIDAGVRPATVAAVVGDTVATIIEHYVHEVDPEARSEAAEALAEALR